MHWSSLSDLLNRSWSTGLSVTDTGIPTESLETSRDYLHRQDSRLVDSSALASVDEETTRKTASFFENLFSFRSHHHHRHEERPLLMSTEEDGQFATRQTAEGGSIPWTPMNPRREQRNRDTYKTGTSTATGRQESLSIEDHERPSVLPLAMTPALRGYDKAAIVKTKYGAVLGNVFDRHRSFLGIPYAVPPVGPNRWKAAIPLKKFVCGEVLDARKFGDHCMQLDTWESSYFRNLMLGLSTKASEDCLSLNVYCPTKRRLASLPDGKKSKLPVLVFIHGGMYTTGGTSAPLYDASNFVDKNDAVVVTFNYRMSIWGFLASRELAEDSPEAGNYALTDAIAALQWVKRFIGNFGGDSDNITVAGHSAGANLVNYLLLALGQKQYRNLGLVHRAALFSGAIGTGRTRYLEEMEDEVTLQPLFDKLADLVGCGEAEDRLACLRSTDAEALVQAGVKQDWAYHWSPVIDGQYLPASPLEMAEQGQVLPVPLLITDCLDDGTIFSVGEPTVTHEDYLALIRKYFGSAAAPVIGDYYGPTPSCDGTPYFEAASLLLRDALITCPLDAFAGLTAASGIGADVYYFRFSTPLSLAWLVGSLPYVPDYGVFHGTELILLFQGLSSLTIGQTHQVNHTQRRFMEWMQGRRPDDPKYPGENPAKRITKPMQVDKICGIWSKWPLSPEFLETKMYDGWTAASTTVSNTLGFTTEIK